MPPVSASTWLQFEVAEDVNNIPHGIAATAPAPDGTPVTFETGAGLRDLSDPPPASSLWNRSANVSMRGYWFDDNQQCLQVGATSIWVAGSGWGLQARPDAADRDARREPGRSSDPPDRASARRGRSGGPPVKETCDDIFTLPASVGRTALLDLPGFATERGGGAGRGDAHRLAGLRCADHRARPRADAGYRQHRQRHAGADRRPRSSSSGRRRRARRSRRLRRSSVSGRSHWSRPASAGRRRRFACTRWPTRRWLGCRNRRWTHPACQCLRSC